MSRLPPGTIVVTGALGNIGFKVLCDLARQSGALRVIGLDALPAREAQREALAAAAAHSSVKPRTRAELLQCDLLDYRDARWRQVFDQVNTVLHFAAKTSLPDSGWAASDESFAMTLHTAQAALNSRTVERYIFASSNHVMGGYKDRDPAPGTLTPEMEPAVGTRWDTGTEQLDSTAYAGARWAGERLCQALAEQAGDQTRFVCVRIGWCQPGENKAKTLSASGSPTSAHSNARAHSAERWFRQMWLSNRDCCQLFRRAAIADSASWPRGSVVVNGMSNNSGMPWSLESTRRLLGYEPEDDAFSP